MLALLELLHIFLVQLAECPLDVDLELSIDRLVDVMWTLSLTECVSPHQCLDRYCDCHLVLYQGEPEGLFPGAHTW
jgi:hypothetical protein